MSGWEQWTRVDASRQRLVFRLVNAYIVGALSRWIGQHDGDLIRGYVWMGLAQSVGDGDHATGVRALSRSLDLPRETVRRKLGELAAAGFGVKREDGSIAVNPERLHGSYAQAVASAELEAILDTYEQFRALGLELPEEAAPAPAADPLLAALSQQRTFILRSCEAGVGVYGSLFNSVIFLGLMHLNAVRVTADLEKAWQYAGADTPPPDEARVSASIGDLAELLGLPRETVRRRIQEFLKWGWAERWEDGFRIAIARMQKPESLAAGAVLSQRFLVLLGGLQKLGLIGQDRAAASA